MKTALLGLLLATSLQGQTILLSESFENGWPEGWQKRFGRAEDGMLSFANRSTSTDVFTPPLDLSGDGPFVLRFSLITAATTDHNLSVGLRTSNTPFMRIAGSPVLASQYGLGLILSSGEGLDTHSVDLGPWLALFEPLERSSVQIGFVSLNAPGLSSAPVWLDDIRVQVAQADSYSYSAIPESSDIACILGAVAFLVLLWKRRATT